MRKKIIAGVAALLMVASVVPANSAFNFTAAPVISASADAVEVNGVSIYLDDSGNVHLQAKNLFEYAGVSNSATSLHIDMSPLKNDILEVAGGSLEEKKVIIDGAQNPLNSKDIFPNLAHIYFDDDIITAVGSYFAANCANLQTVSFGKKIDTIYDSAFQGCSILQGTKGTTLDISNIVYMGEYAFNGCGQINNIKFCDKLTHIGGNAFSFNSALTTATLPATVEFIGDFAFANCNALESIEFTSNETVSYIGISAFANCPKLTAVTVKGKNYNTLPDGGESLICGTSLFSADVSLQSFVWSKRYNQVPDGTFTGCTSLNAFKFDDIENSNCQYVGENCFSTCNSLVSIEMPQKTTAIGAAAFANCNKLEKVVVSDSLEGVGKGAFAYCPVLTLYPRSDKDKTKNKVVLPETWKEINDNTFEGCTGITQVNIDPATFIGKYAFQNCTALKSVKIPDAVETIYDYCFNNCVALKDVVISKDLGTIYDYGFSNCTSLETVTPSDKKAAPYAIQFPASLGGVQQYGFVNCPSFKYLNFTSDSQLAVIGVGAFSNCTGLLGSSSDGTANNIINMPVGVKVIQKSAFAGDTSLDQISFLGEVSTIDANAFQDCTALKKIVMNDTIKQVGEAAFYGCKALEHMPSTPEGKTAFSHVETINGSTFAMCTSLKDAYIPKNITAIGEAAFSGCESMKSVQWEEGSKLAEIGTGAFKDSIALERFSSSTKGDVTEFPDSLHTINANAFDFTALKEIKIGTPADGSAIMLGDYCFADNDAITKADFSGSNAIEIPAGCFANDKNLETVYLSEDSVKKLGSACFSNCYKLHTLGTKDAKNGEYTIPESCTAIASAAFENNYCMQIINFPKTATKLSMSMFNIYLREEEVEENGYTPLEAINVDPENTEYMSEDGVLYNKEKTILYCRPLRIKDETFVVPDSIENIGGSACAANNFLKYVVINENLKSMGDRAFADCHELQNVDFGSNGVVAIGNDAFSGENMFVALYGTAGSTAQDYAINNSYTTMFIDNAKVASTLKILTNEDAEISDELTLSVYAGWYKFGCKQLTENGDEAADSLVWTTSDPEIATINNYGELSIKAMGDVTITVRNRNDTASTSITLHINETGESYLIGDVNGDREINVQDISQLAAHVKGKKALSDTQMKPADVNKDGEVNVKDIVKIAAHVKGVKSIDE